MAFLEVDAGNNPRSVALVSQSGGLLIGFVNRAAARRVPLRTFISSGNEAVTGIEDYLEYLLQDPAIRVAGVICEGIRDLDRLCKIGKAARHTGRRIGLLKLGRSERGRLAVRAHTGRNAGNDREISEALADAGIARVDRPDELLEFCNLAGRAAPPKGRRISTIMVSGGAAALTCDIADRQGLPFANWSPATIEGLRVLLPEHATVANPLDLTGGTMLHNREAIEKAIRLIAADPETDFLSFVFPLQHSGGSVGLRALVEFIAGLAPSLGKPLTVVSTNGGTTSGHWAEFGATSTCPILEDAETAFSAFAKWCP
jgi:acyl-CoA synthetase (NDP forming)